MKRMSVRFPAAVAEALRARADALGVTQVEVMRRCLRHVEEQPVCNDEITAMTTYEGPILAVPAEIIPDGIGPGELRCFVAVALERTKYIRAAVNTAPLMTRHPETGEMGPYWYDARGKLRKG